jgi:hypothetical protein
MVGGGGTHGAARQAEVTNRICADDLFGELVPGVQIVDRVLLAIAGR